MNDIETRLRDAYRGATDTVRPEAIRGLGERATVISPSARWWARGALHRLLVPLTAAAAVVVIGIVAAVVVPDALHGARNLSKDAGSPIAGNPATHFLVGLASGETSYLSIRSAITGTAMAAVAPPAGWRFAGAATSNGVSYVAALTWPGHCGTWLRRFTISRRGQPSQLTNFEPGYWGWSQMIEDLAISRNGRTLAFVARTCPRPAARAEKASIGVIVTKPTSNNGWEARGTYWRLPSLNFVNSLSLSADGRQLAFSTALTSRSASAVFVLPTDAAAGSAVQRSRVVVKAARFGSHTAIGGSAMTPDGRTIYFTTDQAGEASNGRWALRAVDVASGRSRLITEQRGFGVHLVASPSMRELIAFARTVPPPRPEPVGTPSPSPSGSQPVPSGSPSPVPVTSPGTSPAPTPVPSGSPTPVPSSTGPSPSGSPSPVPSGSVPSSSGTPVPSASPTGTLDALIQPFEVIRIQLPGGRVRYLNPVPWDVPGFIYIW